MNQKSSLPFLLNHVTNPTALFPVYQAIEEGSEKEQDIKDTTGLGELVPESLKSLLIFGLRKRINYSLRTVELVKEGLEKFTTKDKFKYQIITNLAIGDSEDFAKRSVVLLIYKYLLKEENEFFSPKEKTLISSIQKWFDKIGYEPKGSGRGNKIKLNKQKLDRWAKLSRYLGLISKVGMIKSRSSKYYSTCLNTNLLLMGMMRYKKNSLKQPIILTDFINWSNKEFIPIPLIDGKKIPSQISRALYNLAKDGYIALEKYGDARSLKFSGVDSYYNSSISETFNSVRVKR